MTQKERELHEKIRKLQRVIADVPACAMTKDWFARHAETVGESLRDCIYRGE